MSPQLAAGISLSPGLSLAAKTVRGVQQCHQQGSTNRADGRNLTKQLHGRMLAALDQQVASRLLAHRCSRSSC